MPQNQCTRLVKLEHFCALTGNPNLSQIHAQDLSRPLNSRDEFRELLDKKFTDRITLIFSSYSAQE